MLTIRHLVESKEALCKAKILLKQRENRLAGAAGTSTILTHFVSQSASAASTSVTLLRTVSL